MAVRSASVPRAPAAKAEIAVDSRILLPQRPEAVRKIDIRIRMNTLEIHDNWRFYILIYFDFPQFSDDLTPDCVQQLIGMHLLVANIAVIAVVAVVAVFAVIAVGCGYTKQEGARRQRHSSEMFRNSIATKLSDSCSMLLGFFSS